MITLRRSEERRHLQSGGRDTWRTFDAERTGDPLRLGFRTLRTFDEERVGPGSSFGVQLAEDVELLTYVREGILVEEGAPGGARVMETGECRRSRSTSGGARRLVNRSSTDVARAFRSGIQPDRKEGRSRVEQKRFPFAGRRGMLRLTASPDGEGGSLQVDQDIRIYSAILDRGHHVIHELGPGRGAWIHVVEGRIRLVDHLLGAGDGASLVEEAAVSWTALEAAEILLFDMA